MSDNAFEAAGIVAERNIAIAMRDGVTLRANLFRPAGGGPAPALVLRIPYNKDAAQTYVYAHPAWYARHGYAVLVQDSRGRYASEGEFYPLRLDAEDGYDTIEWCAAQPWCDGQVGSYGFSIPGINQLLAAHLRGERPPALDLVDFLLPDHRFPRSAARVQPRSSAGTSYRRRSRRRARSPPRRSRARGAVYSGADPAAARRCLASA